MTFEQLLSQLPEGFDKLSETDQIASILVIMTTGYTAMKEAEAKAVIRAEYEAKRVAIQEKANKELEAVQKEYGIKLA